MPFGMLRGLGPWKHVVDMGPDYPMHNGNFEGERAAHCEVFGCSAMSCEKMAEPIDMPLGGWARGSMY